MISPSYRKPEDQSSSGRGWSFIKGESGGGSVCGTCFSFERSIEVKPRISSLKEGRPDALRIVNNYVASRNNGHESFSLMRIASLLFWNDNSRYEAKFGVDLFTYVRFNQQMDVTHVVWHAIGWFEGSNFCTTKFVNTTKLWTRREINVRASWSLLNLID